MKKIVQILPFLILLALIFGALGVTPAYAATITVSNANDTGPGSLRDAIALAAAGDTITFNGDMTILLASELTIAKDLTIDGETHSVTVSGQTVTGVFKVTSGNVTFKHLIIAAGNATSNCYVQKCGGGILYMPGYNGGTLTVTDSTVSGNNAQSGGGIYNGGTLTVMNTTVSGNSAQSGGGIYNGFGGMLTVTDSTISSNSAGYGGGGIYNSTYSTGTVMNSTVSGNSAYIGGGIENEGVLTVTNSTVSSNSADSYGGGIYSIDTLTVMNSTISGNIAKGSHSGGIYSSDTVTVTNSTFSGNSAKLKGGAILNDGALTVTNSTFSGNSAYDGGGIWNDSALTVTNSTFSSNSAIKNGGGIWNFGALTVTNSTFSGNSATVNGGGIYNYSDGGVCTATPAVSMINTTFSGNKGGGIHNGRGVIEISYSTVTSNTGAGVRSYNDAATCTRIGGSMIAGNTGGDVSAVLTTHRFYSLDYNLIGAAGKNVDFGKEFNQAHDRTAVSSLLLGALGNYTCPGGQCQGGGSTQTIPLLPGSPAIDMGGSLCPATDQRGYSRVDACDIGAFESQGFTLTKTGGDNQSAGINTAFANPLALSVTATDANEPVNGGVVTFTAPTGGAGINLAVKTATIASGAVSKSVTANGTVGGPYTVTASAAGALSVDFSLTNIAAPPTATTNAASAISSTTATLNGKVNAHNDSSTVTFEYGLDTSYGATVTAAQSPVAGNKNILVSKAISGLTPNTTYHFRVVASSSAGTTNGSDLTFTTSAIFTSDAAQDGWILESSETSNQGGTLDVGSTYFYLGDQTGDKQYRAILSFDTEPLPDNAIITAVTLKIKRPASGFLVGNNNPFTWGLGLKADLCKNSFGATTSLELSDFNFNNAANCKLLIGTFGSAPTANWYSVNILNTAFAKINTTGWTQFRLRFAKDDNDDGQADYLKFYSGNADAANSPQLIIQYTVP